MKTGLISGSVSPDGSCPRRPRRSGNGRVSQPATRSCSLSPRSPDGAGVGSCSYVGGGRRGCGGVCAVWFWQRTPDVASEAGAGAEISAAQPLEYRTACGERLDIVLPDGSKVCMNSEATLTVDPGFGKATREIEFDGEAFFTISPDKNCPFIIHSANNNYAVLGTSFNLQSYARENFAVVTLHTGCLQAQARKDVIILDPLDTAIVFWIAASALSFILALFVSKKSHA